MTTSSTTQSPGPPAGSLDPGRTAADEHDVGLPDRLLRRLLARRPSRPDRLDVATWVVLALLSYVPSFLTRPGLVAADTKQYLYLDPGRLISSAISMWNPDVGAGTVTHQNIGYLFPMGPYYWVVAQLHLPMWVGQRFWMGSLFFAAGTGVLFCGRLLGLSRSGRLAAALAYMFTPFILDYITRISAIVMPWAALGWILGLTILAVRRRTWRYPALLAVVVAVVGGVNATSILLVAVAPILWVVWAVFVTREAAFKAALAAVVRIAFLSVLISAWWVAGLWAEGAYGLNVLRYTESLPTVALTSSASESVRGLGYWYFYGQDKLGAWTQAADDYLQAAWLLVVSFAVPVGAILLGWLGRWRYRTFAVALIVVGVVIAVGVYPYDDPTPVGRLLESTSNSTFGLATRSTNRVLPIAILGFALLIGSGVTALAAWRPWAGLGTLGLVAVLVAADLPAMWTGSLVQTNLARPEQLPGYVLAAANYMNGQSHDTRVLQLPGQDFAYYRWGVTADSVWPGLMTRPFLERVSQPAGEPASANLLQALDESVQDGIFVPSTLVPVAHLLGVGDILYESDIQFERFNNARPGVVWLELTNPATGLGHPVSFGPPTNYQPITFPLTDETQLAIPTGARTPPPVAVIAVPGTPSIVRTQSPATPIVLAGDGQGILAAAAAGLLGDNPTVFYSGTYAHDQPGFAAQMARDAVLVLTDTNQKRQDTWGTTDSNYGYVQQANYQALPGSDPAEQALPVLSGAGSDTQTVAVLSGGDIASVEATSYGNPVANNPEYQPYNAVDGNLQTAWREGAFEPATNQSLQIALTHPVTTDHLTLVQPQNGPRNRHVTEVTLTFDGHSQARESLGQASLGPAGQVVHFPRQTFSTLKLTVEATSAGIRSTYQPFASVGFAEVEIPGVAPSQEVLRLPTDLLAHAGTASRNRQLDVLLSRIRATVVPGRIDPEANLQRTFTLPTARTFSVSGTARISTLDSDFLVNQLLGRISFDATPLPAQTAAAQATGDAVVISSNSSGRLPGDLNATAYAAMDRNPNTSWMPGLGDVQNGSWVQYSLSRPVTFDHLDLQVVADGRHSIPTQLTITAQGGPGGPQTRTVTLPPVAVGRGRPQGSTSPAPVSFPALTGSDITVTIDKTEPVTFLDYISEVQNTEPVGLAELGLPGVVEAPTPATVPVRCLSGLVQVDGQPVDVEVTGSTKSALANGGLNVAACGPSSGGVHVAAGRQTVRTATRDLTGFNVDNLNLASAPGGGPLPLTGAGLLPAPAHATPSLEGPKAAPTPPAVRVVSQSRTSLTVSVAGHGTPFWLTLGQSQSAGWKATTAGGVSLGPSTLINGYANGWYVPGRLATGPTTITLTWTPQRVVNVAIVVSAVTLLASLLLGILPSGYLGRRLTRRRARTRRRRGQPRGATVLAATSTADGASGPVSVPAGRDGPAPDPETAVPARPLLGSLLRFEDPPPGTAVTIVTVLVAAALAAVFVSPLAVAFVAPVVLLGLRVDRSRPLLLGGSVLLLVAAVGDMVVRQLAHRFPSDINWPSQFPAANTLAWLAVLALGSEAVVELVRRGRRRPGRGRTGPAVGRRAGPAAHVLAPPGEGVLEPQGGLLDDEVGAGRREDRESEHGAEEGPELDVEEVQSADVEHLVDPGLVPQVDAVGDDAEGEHRPPAEELSDQPLA